MSTVIVAYKKSYLIQIFARKVLFSILAVFLIIRQIVDHGTSGLSAILFWVLVLFLIWRNGKRRWAQLQGRFPALLVSEEGFIDYTTFYEVGVVRWEEVEEVAAFGFFRLTKSIRVLLKQPKALIRREQRPLYRALMTWVLLFNKTPYFWEAKLLAVPQKELLLLLQEIKAGTYDFDDLGQHLIEQ